MASQQDIEKLLDKLEKAYDKLGRTNPFKNFDTSNITDAQATIDQLETALEGVNARLDATKQTFTDLNKTLTEIVKEINPKAVNNAKAFENGFKGIISEAKKLQYEEEGINRLSKKELENIGKKIEKRKSDAQAAAQALLAENNISATIDRRTSAYKNLTEDQKAAINYLRDTGKQEDAILDKVAQRIKQEERVAELMGIGGAAVAGTKTALEKLGFGGLATSLGLDDVQQQMEETAREMEEAGENTSSWSNKMKVLNVGISAAGQNLKKSLTDPAVIITFLLKEMISALQSADKATGELAKAMGTSYSEASSMRNELINIANTTYDINVSAAKLQESLVALNKEFGTATMMSGELLVDFTQLTKVAGYSTEAALGLSRITAATGTDLSENTEEILGSAVAFNAANKLALNEKEIVEGVAKASKAATLSMGMQPGKLALAVAQAKALGMELSDIENIASGLLNFESSISAELEAELLTGKDLNFEKARLLALNNDLEGVAKEVANQLGSAAEFTKMNAIQQEALAQSVGLTREQLAGSLMEQQALTKLSAVEGKNAQEKFNNLVKEVGLEEAKKRMGDETLANQMASQSVQERFNASMEKMREIFITIAEPILQIVSPLMDLVGAILPAINLLLQPILWVIQQIGEAVNGFTSLLKGDIKDGLGGFLQIAQSIAVVWAGIVGIQKLMNTETKVGIALQKTFQAISSRGFWQAIGTAIAKIWGKIVEFLGPFGVPVAIAASAGLVGLASKYFTKGNDVVSEGYGKRTLLAGKDAIALNDEDTVIAGTDLMGKKKSKKDSGESASTSSSPSIDITPLIDRMSAVEGVLQQILAKETNIYLDSTKVGTGFAVASSKVQ